MSKPRGGPDRRTILAIALAGVIGPACVIGIGMGTLGVAELPAAASVPAATAVAPAALLGTMPWAPPAAAPADALPWAPVPSPVPDLVIPAEPASDDSAPAPDPAPRPVHVSLDRLDISSDLMTLGLNPDGTVEVPPSARHAPAGWYDGSAPPGDAGAAVILGHVDSVYGPGVFYRLREARPGDRIAVGRDDGSTVEFTVDRVGTYPRPDFPTDEVYGPLDHAGLRLITCGGPYVKARGGYQSNVIVFASLASS